MNVSSLLLLRLILLNSSCSADKDYHKLIKLDDKSFGKYPLVIRVDRSDNSKWKEICDEIKQPQSANRYEAYVDFLDDRVLQNSSIEEIQQSLTDNTVYNNSHSFFFIVDSITIASPEMPILCVSLFPEDTSYYRVIPIQVQSIENNLTTANLLYDELHIIKDKDGIIRNWTAKKRK